jgi:hypothetical protein
MDSLPPSIFQAELLCTFCRQHDLDYIYNWPITKDRQDSSKEPYQKLQRTLSDLQTSLICPLCELVYSGLVQRYGHYVLKAFPSDSIITCYVECEVSDNELSKYAVEVFRPTMGPVGSSVYGSQRICIELRNPPAACEIRRFAAGDSGISIPPERENLMLGRRIAPEVDMGLILDWLNLCDDHGADCRPKMLKPATKGSMDDRCKEMDAGCCF